MNRREFLTLGACAAAVDCLADAVPFVDPKSVDVAAFDAAVKTLSETTLFDVEKRKDALEVVQRHIYAMQNAKPFVQMIRGGTRIPDKVVAQFHQDNPPLKWLDESFDKVLKELQETKVPVGGKPAVWYVYNMGIVVKTPKCAFSIDLCHRKAPLLVPHLDFALVTHNHGDHYTDEFLGAMSRNKKPIRSSFLLDWGNYSRLEKDEKQYFDVLVKSTAADHNSRLPKAVTCFECHIGEEGAEKFVIFHSGDCCRADHLQPSVPHPDLFFGHCAIGLNFKTAYQTTMPAKLMLPVHHQELGHLGGRWRCVGFHEEPAKILRELKEIGARAAMPVWGDRVC